MKAGARWPSFFLPHSSRHAVLPAASVDTPDPDMESWNCPLSFLPAVRRGRKQAPTEALHEGLLCACPGHRFIVPAGPALRDATTRLGRGASDRTSGRT